MIFKQLRYEALAQAGYLVACEEAKTGLVVDPAADLGPEHYLLEAADFGVTLAGVLETHLHADYISCARELAAEAGVPHYLHESAAGRTRYSFAPLRDRQVLGVGLVEVEVLFTPGHTPEHVCYLVTDRGRGPEPWFVLTGDSLLVGDVGRPDLMLGDAALDVMDESERAATLYRSIKQRLFTLPDDVEIYPNHYGGSSCGGANLSGKASSTIGREKHYNLPMQQPDAAAFAKFVRETSRPAPDGFQRIKAINLGLAEPSSSATRALGPAEVAELIEGGTVVVDIRRPLRFATGHIRGAVNIAFNRVDLADRAFLALPEDANVVVLGEPDAVAVEAVDLLSARGWRVAGYLSAGLAAWQIAGRPVAKLPVLSVEALHEHQAEFIVVDARERHEYRQGHIEGALLTPTTDLPAALSRLPSGARLAVHCTALTRASLVASLIAGQGHDVRLVAGGMNAWQDRGFPVVEEPALVR